MSSSLTPCRAVSWLGGAALGAGLMFLLDSNKGSGRRADLRHLTAIAAAKIRNLKTRNLLSPHAPRQSAGARKLSFVSRPHVPDWVLAERARLEIWRGVAHPESVQVTARDGRLTLWGPVLAGEPETLREKLAKLPGLRRLELQLTIRQETAARVA